MENHPTTVDIVIAGFSIRLFSNAEIELEEGYLPFVVENKTLKTDISVECIAGIPTTLFEQTHPVFEAENDEKKFYSIYRVASNLGFVIYNQENGSIQQIALLNNDFTHWKIYSEKTSSGSILPFRYPMGPIVMHYMTFTSGAVMMHASCAFDGKKARLFSGFSGAGKSTISKLWSDAGSMIVNDDRLIIRKQGDEYFVHNTPMYYKDIPKKVRLNSIFLISHSPENKIQKLTGALAISNVMAFSIQNNFDKQFVQSRLELFHDICSHVSVYKLGFVPNQSVVNFIRSHEAGEND